MAEHAIVFENVTHRYGSKTALKDVSFSVPEGAIFGLIGPNGSGKSTTLNILTTLLRASEGRVTVMGHDVASDPMAVKAALGYAPEEVNLYNGLSAREFVTLSATLHHLEPEEAARRAGELLTFFGLEERIDDQLGTFPKGMRRKSLIATALVHRPDILVLDEPMEGLDVVAQKMLKDRVRDHAAAGGTVVYSTHILEILEGFATHVLLLRAGEVLGCGSLAQVREGLGIETLAEAFLGTGSTP